MNWSLAVGKPDRGWETTQLRHFLTRRRRTGYRDLPLLSVNLVEGVTQRWTSDGRPAPAEDLGGYQLVMPGDLVMNQLGKPHGSLGVSDQPGIISPAYFVAEIDGRRAWPRYVHHLLRTRLYISEYERRGKFMPPSQFDISWQEFRSIPVALPPLATQRQIADFLDAETARIDALVTARTRLSVLLEERRSALLSAAVTVGLDSGETTATGHQFAPLVAAGWPVRRLRHVLSEIVDTEHKTAPAVDDGDFLVVRTANVRRGQLVLDNAQYTNLDTWREWTSRGVPKPGDVIFTREAPAGEACVVPPSPPLCLGQRTVLLRPRADMILGPWLVHSIYAGAARHFIDVLSRSTTVAHVNMSDIPDIPVVVPSVTEQAHTLAALDRELEPVTRLSAACAAQTSLLQERKQALITAAVTGQLDIARGIAEEAS